jgi:uroporphyrin-III C-methyltransferase/precorrin-2 dehydrogenase/sirohydrochlorin ferrochelatase
MPASRKPAEAAPPRLGSLAKLPVFFDLDGKRAVVAGGTAAAAWKAELIAAAGANVEVYANGCAPEMSELLTRGAASGTITHHARTWSADALSGAAIAIADVDSETEAAAFANAARSAGVPFNVIDKPAYCQFQIGSIVNRSPVVVAISTDGAAPILGQAIRRRIEAVLPPSLGAWGRLAKALRDDVAVRLPAGPLRRRFWEQLAERAFGPPPGAYEGMRLRASLQGPTEDIDPECGRVTLVGAGPGDAELLTLKAVRALQSADVILYDDLVSGDVLELARREARRICVGKRGHRESCRQDDINDLMIRLAREGYRVVRLKSGDPAIFGRAGEEVARLTEAGIAVEIVPGITAASGMAARLGLSLTHRDGAQSVRFVTAHGRHGSLPDGLDWRGLADQATTLVIYMGGRIAGAFAHRLLDEGLPPTTPAAAVAGVSHPDERRWVGTLGEMAAGRLALAARGAPVIIGIGKVFAPASMNPEHGSSTETYARTYPAGAAADAPPMMQNDRARSEPGRRHPQSDRHQSFEPV